jgi:uncharacterized delta-60 repeat protein
MMATHKYRWQPLLWLPIAAVCVLSAPALGQTNYPGTLDTSFEAVPFPQSQINALVRTFDGTFIIGGLQNPNDPVLRGGVARLHQNGALDTNFNIGSGANGSVWSIALQTNGQILIAGDFSEFNGASRSRVARLNPDGSLDTTFGPPMTDATVFSIAVDAQRRIVVGGDFTSVDGTPRWRVARLTSSGTLDPSFNTAAGPNSTVRNLVIQADGSIVIVGGFSGVGSEARNRIARLGPTGAVDVGFGAGGGANEWVSAVAALRSGKLLVTGFFTRIDGTTRRRVARLHADGTLDTTFDVGIGPDNGVTALAEQSDGRIILGGGFGTFSGTIQGRIARIHADGSLDTLFEANPGANPNGWVEALLLQHDGKVVLAGNFSAYDPIERHNIARVFAADPQPFAPVVLSFPTSSTVQEGVDVTFDARVRAFPEPTFQWRFNDVNLPDATSSALVLPNVRTTNAGAYSLVASNSLGAVTNVVNLTITPAPSHPGALDVDFYTGIGATNFGMSLILQDGKVVLGGGTYGVNGLPTGFVRRFGAEGTPDATFQPTPIGFGSINAVVPSSNGTVIVGGTAIRSVRRLLADGTIDPSYPGSVVADFLYGLAPYGTDQVIGGGANVPSGAIALRRFRNDSSLDPSFPIIASERGTIYAVAVQPDGRIIAAGDFTAIAGQARNRIARFNTNGTIDMTFNAGSGANSRVNAVIVQSDGRILIGGAFTRINGVTRNRVARLLPNGALDTTFDPGPGPDHNVFAVARQADGRVLIGGAFAGVSEVVRQNVARLNPDGSLDAGFDTTNGPNGVVEDIVPVGEDILIAGAFLTVGGVTRPAIARLHGGSSADAAPTIIVAPIGQDVTEGANVTMFVVAQAQPAATYQWQLFGTNVPGATNWTLHLRNVRVADAGLYQVVVSNSRGSVVSGERIVRVETADRNAGLPDIDFFAGTGPNDKVNAIVLQPDGRIVIGGFFTEVNGLTRGGIARLHRTGEIDPTFNPGAGANGPVFALARQADGKFLIGGSFTLMNTVQRLRIARLHPDGSLDATFDPGASLHVNTIHVRPNSQIALGGTFTSVRGVYSPGIALLQGDGVFDTNFQSRLLAGTIVTDIDFQQDGKPIVGGFMPLAFAPYPSKIARLQLDGQVDSTFSISLAYGGWVNSLAVLPDERVLAGGSFVAVQTNERHRIMRFTPNGAIDVSFDLVYGASNTVNVVTMQQDQKALVGGQFEGIGGYPFKRLARLSASGAVDATFNPGRGVENGTAFIDEYGEFVDFTSVNTIAVEADGHIMIGGDFTEVNGVARPYLARVFGRSLSTAITVRRVSPFIIEMTWERGTLEHAISPAGPWRDLANATSPWQVSTTTGQRFFRLRID